MMLYSEKILKWLNITFDEYMESTIMDTDNQFEPYMYPEWGEMLEYMEKLIKSEIINEDIIQEILVLLSMDNEDENILDFLVQYASDEYIRGIVEKGIQFESYQTRWQIAKILGLRKVYGWKSKIQILCNDKNDYVSKRANQIMDDRHCHSVN